MGIRDALLAIGVVAGMASHATQAALVDRGGGLLYDNVLNVTWLQDANYAKTSGYDADGQMTWSQAITWAANLVYHDSVRNVHYSDWRLASNSPVNGATWNYVFSSDGSTDMGFNITSAHSELAYMYYVNLGLKGSRSPADAFQPNFGVFGNGAGGGQANVGLVRNLQASFYWSGSPSALDPVNMAWTFSTYEGVQFTYNSSDNGRYSWAVRSGDVAAVPEPMSWAMLIAGLALLGAVVSGRRRR